MIAGETGSVLLLPWHMPISASTSSPSRSILQKLFSLRATYVVLFQLMCGVGGLCLAAIAHSRYVAKPPAGVAFGVDRLSSDVLATQIRTAQKEIAVSARQLTSEKVLRALREASQHGRAVRVLLDRSENPDPTRGCAGYLRHHQVGDVRLSDTPLYDQFLIVDGDRVYVTSAPWSAAALNNSAEATIVAVRMKGLGESLRARFELLFGVAQRIQ